MLAIFWSLVLNANAQATVGAHHGMIISKPTLTMEYVVKSDELELYFWNSAGVPITDGMTVSASLQSNRPGVAKQKIDFSQNGQVVSGSYNSSAGSNLTITIDAKGPGASGGPASPARGGSATSSVNQGAPAGQGAEAGPVNATTTANQNANGDGSSNSTAGETSAAAAAGKQNSEKFILHISTD